MEQTFKISKSKTPFEQMEVPEFNGSYIPIAFRIPTSVPYNQTIYMYVSSTNELKAVRIMAISFTFACDRISALVQFPGDVPFWVNDIFKNPMFKSKEHFFSYTMGCACPLDLNWKCVRDIYPSYCHAAVVSLKNYCWKWVNGAARNGVECPPIEYLLINDEGTFVCIRENYYTTQEECIKENLNGLVIDDFDDEVFAVKTITLPATQKIHTLRFVED